MPRLWKDVRFLDRTSRTRHPGTPARRSRFPGRAGRGASRDAAQLPDLWREHREPERARQASSRGSPGRDWPGGRAARTGDPADPVGEEGRPLRQQDRRQLGALGSQRRRFLAGRRRRGDRRGPRGFLHGRSGSRAPLGSPLVDCEKVLPQFGLGPEDEPAHRAGEGRGRHLRLERKGSEGRILQGYPNRPLLTVW